MIFYIVAMFFYSFSSFAQNTIYGPWKSKGSFDVRYVTTYEVRTVKRPLKNFPWIESDCHDTGNRFANWSKSVSYEIVYGGKVSFGLLGILDLELGGEKSKTVEYTFQRWVTPTQGIRARHVLKESFEIWEGSTRKEYRYGEETELDEESKPFSLSKMNYGIFVERTILERCDPNAKFAN